MSVGSEVSEGVGEVSDAVVAPSDGSGPLGFESHGPFALGTGGDPTDGDVGAIDSAKG